ncbi:MAG: hypothetical protein ACI9MR_003973 [Myxococcota bacterium]|jgi:hypothetical protein
MPAPGGHINCRLRLPRWPGRPLGFGSRIGGVPWVNLEQTPWVDVLQTPAPNSEVSVDRPIRLAFVFVFLLGMFATPGVSVAAEPSPTIAAIQDDLVAIFKAAPKRFSPVAKRTINKDGKRWMKTGTQQLGASKSTAVIVVAGAPKTASFIAVYAGDKGAKRAATAKVETALASFPAASGFSVERLANGVYRVTRRKKDIAYVWTRPTDTPGTVSVVRPLGSRTLAQAAKRVLKMDERAFRSLVKAGKGDASTGFVPAKRAFAGAVGATVSMTAAGPTWSNRYPGYPAEALWAQLKRHLPMSTGTPLKDAVGGFAVDFVTRKGQLSVHHRFRVRSNKKSAGATLSIARLVVDEAVRAKDAKVASLIGQLSGPLHTYSAANQAMWDAFGAAAKKKGGRLGRTGVLQKRVVPALKRQFQALERLIVAVGRLEASVAALGCGALAGDLHTVGERLTGAQSKLLQGQIAIEAASSAATKARLTKSMKQAQTYIEAWGAKHITAYDTLIGLKTVCR